MMKFGLGALGALSLSLAALLSACGGGSDGNSGALAAALQTDSVDGRKQAMAVSASVESLPLDAYRSFQVTTPGFTDRFARHAGSLGFTAVVEAGSSDLLKKDATFKIVRGLADANCRSLESLNYPGEYLRHSGSRIRKDRRDTSALFDLDATWCGQPGLSGVGVTLASKNYPGRYLRNSNGELWLAQSGGPLPSDTPAGFANDTSWSTVMPWSADANPCNALVWQPGTNYQLGNVVQYPANGRYYKVVNVISTGTDMTDPTISTWYWAPTTCEAPPAPTPPPPPSPVSGRFVGGYYPWWVGSPIRIKDLDPHYNLIYLFAATPEGGDTSGRVRFQAPADGNGAWTNWGADIQYARTVQKRKVLLSVGGAGFGMAFPNRAKSQTFVDSIDTLYNAWGGFDGMDFNTFEGSQAPDTAEMIWIAKELKRRHPGFIISAPPAPWNKVDQTFCKDMLDAGALDFCAPQYYDGPNLADPAWIMTNVDVWMKLLGPSNVVIGLGVDPQANNYETIDVAESVWAQIKAKYPATRGAFDWQINNDALQGYPFAKRLGPAIAN